MVDALKQARRWLRPGGLLVDLHPIADPALLIVGDMIAGSGGTEHLRIRREDAEKRSCLGVNSHDRGIDGSRDVQIPVGTNLDAARNAEAPRPRRDKFAKKHDSRVTFHN